MSEPNAFPAIRPNRYRDTWCGQVLGDRVGETARVAGWVHRRRDHGGLIFIDLRDRTGLVQLVFNPDAAGPAQELGHRLRAEDVISVAGEVVKRDPETVNPDLATGEFELRAVEAELVADADTPPFEIEGFSGEVGEELRLRYRYLDLRRDRMRDALMLRSRVTAEIRRFLDDQGFIDVETPVLTRSTPEGARDFLVPSRNQAGSFYALPQSPQLFKQLLMIGGVERYYQIARCFRDEDQRADRQLDFTQLDLEMAFVEVDDVIDVNERLLQMVLGAHGIDLELPLRRIPYDDAIARFGSDRPDLRFGLELEDVTDELRATEFNAFRGVVDSGGAVKALNAGAHQLSRAQLDGLVEEAKELGAKGLVWAVVEDGGWRSPVAKFLAEGEISRINERLGLVDETANELAWVVDWPLFEWNEGEERWDPLHHPFTSPEGELDPVDPAGARALAYDVVWNGVELGGGSIRISDPDVQRAVFEVLGIGPEEAEARFGFLLEALRFGAPPHGGIAYGLDRWVALIHGVESIRDVIAFPKAASGADPLTGAPAPVSEEQLRELGIAVRGRPGRGGGGG